MRKEVLKLLAKQVIQTALGNNGIRVLMGFIAALLVYALITGITTFEEQTESRIRFKTEVRERWEAMPDKHPHRMAHYGYIVFREKHALSVFDFGTESYTGNAMFLEAHKQNSVNFSEAGFSTGLLRFGEMSMARVLQLLLPLMLFFIGYGTVAIDRENGTLKLLLSQGTSWKEILIGKAIGLMTLATCFLFFSFIILIAGLAISGIAINLDASLRLLYLFLTYTIYFAIISMVAVMVSAVSSRSKLALVGLIGIWLAFAIVLPRGTQAMGGYLFPSPSKIEFESAIEKDVIKQGDSHDPNDPHYVALRDSVLRAYKADSIQQLPFNFSGFQMKEGERLSAEAYNKHQTGLLQIYQHQNLVARIAALINPFAAIYNSSMSLSGTDFKNYVRFQEQAEAYRYKLAQHMNDLQIKLISNNKLSATDQPYSISSDYWKSFPDFSFMAMSQSEAVRTEWISITALLFWVMLLLLFIKVLSKTIKPF